MANNAESRQRIAIGAIFKNEGPYILEWLAFHRVVGIDRFFIADNNSDDGTTDLLAALHALGLVMHIPFPHLRGEPAQIAAYAEIMRLHSRDADWIALIDADEFLVPTNDANSIRSAFQTADADVGAIAVNWAIYGSSFLKVPTQQLVIERFQRRADQRFSVNHHYKTVVRSAAFRREGPNPHVVQMRDGFRFIQANGQSIPTNTQAGLSADVNWHPLRLNHYVVKSEAEFLKNKVPRGRATTSTKRDHKFFINHDRNEIKDVMPDWLCRGTKTEMEAIRDSLRSRGVDSAIVALDVKALESIAAEYHESVNNAHTQTARRVPLHDE